MPSRSRSKPSAPIRKRRSKQTLAKVAERKAAHTASLARKLDAAEERSRLARPVVRSLISPSPHLHAYPSTTSQLKKGTAGKAESESDDDGQEDDDDPMACGKAFDSLVAQLSRSHDIPSIAPDRKGSARNARAKSHPASDEAVTMIHERALTTEEVEQARRAASAREAIHFNSSLQPAALKPSKPESLALPTMPSLRAATYGVSAETREEVSATVMADAPVALGLQPGIHAKWTKLRPIPHLPALRVFTAALARFVDVLLAAPLPSAVDDAARRLVVAHAVAHVLRTRARVTKNNERLRKKGRTGADVQEGKPDKEQKNEADDFEIRDQGFARARVLFVLPMRNVAYEIVKTIIALVVGGDDKFRGGAQTANSQRFETEFGPDPAEEEEGEDEEDEFDGDDDNVDGAGSAKRPKRKPSDYRRTFRGNIDDDFRLGLSLSPKGVRLFTDFYDSDIIIASPLGLRRASAERAAGVDTASQMRRRERERERNTEWKTGLDAPRSQPAREASDDAFLSSVEVAVVDGAHVFSMQNWDSLMRCMTSINRMPESPRETDFSRVREWCLEGLMARFRQTVVLSRYRKSEFLQLFRSGQNHAGALTLVEPTRGHCAIMDVTVRMHKTFLRVPEADSPAEAPDKRLQYFFERVFPSLRVLVDSQCLVITPSYFDFVRVRNRLLKVSEDDETFRFASMCEYSRVNDISRVRAKLFDRRVSVVLMTERFHFFWRHWIRGANTVVWYGLPENAQFYPEILNMTAEAREEDRTVQSVALFDKYDAFALERIVGAERTKRMLSKSARSTFMFT